MYCHVRVFERVFRKHSGPLFRTILMPAGDPALDATKPQAQPGYPVVYNGHPAPHAVQQPPQYIPQQQVPVHPNGAYAPVDPAQLQYLQQAGKESDACVHLAS